MAVPIHHCLKTLFNTGLLNITSQYYNIILLIIIFFECDSITFESHLCPAPLLFCHQGIYWTTRQTLGGSVSSSGRWSPQKQFRTAQGSQLPTRSCLKGTTHNTVAHLLHPWNADKQHQIVEQNGKSSKIFAMRTSRTTYDILSFGGKFTNAKNNWSA